MKLPERLRFPERVRLPKWSLNTIAAVLALMALAAIAVYAVTGAGAVHDWAPNIATGALAIIVTVKVVDGIVRREARERMEAIAKGSADESKAEAEAHEPSSTRPVASQRTGVHKD